MQGGRELGRVKADCLGFLLEIGIASGSEAAYPIATLLERALQRILDKTKMNGKQNPLSSSGSKKQALRWCLRTGSR